MDRNGADRLVHLLDDGTSRYLGAAGARVEFRRGQALMRAGDVGDCVHLILAGRVKVTNTGISGDEVILDFGWPGDLYGEMSVMTSRPRIATVVALEPVVTRQIPAPAFRRSIETFPNLGAVVLRMTARRLAEANARRVVGPSDDVTAQVARRLLELVRVCGERVPQGWWIDLPLTNREIAQFIPTSKSSLDRALAQLRAMDIVRTGYRQTVITDLERLRTVTAESNE